jgi:thiol:disulfide interchange protein DsbD
MTDALPCRPTAHERALATRARASGAPVRARARLAARLAAWFATLASVVVASVAFAPAALADDDFLPPEQAYRYTVRADGSQLTITYAIEKGYYLYKKRMGAATDTPGVTLGAPVLPTGLPHSDEFFGEQEIYRQAVTFTVPYTVQGAAPATLNLKLKLQGCADAGLCYPPQTWPTQVRLPAQKAAVSAAATGAGAGNDLFAQRGSADDEFLPVEQAYRLSAVPAGADAIRVTFDIADGYYLYRHRMGVKSDDTRLQLGTPTLPAGLPHEDEFFGKQEIYRGQAEMVVPYTRTADSAGPHQIKVQYQGCADAGLCYPPTTTMVTVSLPGGGAVAAAGVAGTTTGGGAAQAAASASAGAGAPSLLVMLGFALLGGMLLNLMPCVLPVLSIKAVSLAAAQGADPAGVRAKGYAYTGGVLASMLLLAGALLALRAAGEQIGWGFQLQSPGFVLALTYLLLLVGLNLSGVFEVGGSLAGAGDRLTQGDGTRASFFTGVLTTLVATPCTAPFMATAVGVALTQSTGTALAVFAALGLGLALPYLVLSLAPAARRFLPKPGAWMNRFKQALAFPMYASAGWLLWVLAQQASPPMLGAAIAGLVLIALAAWCYELVKTSQGGWKFASIGTAVAALALALAIPFGLGGDATARTAATAAGGAGTDSTAGAESDDGWQAFATSRVEQLVAQGQPVFVVFTADWCVTCKVNERVAIETDEMRRLFDAKGVALVKADWTNQDATIAAELARHGRAGVPLYLYYAPGASAPQVLPQILTPGSVRELVQALPDRAGGRTV